MKPVKQINDIQIKVTKEEVAKEFIKHYKYDKWNVYTETDAVKEIVKKCVKIFVALLIVAGLIFLLFCSPEPTTSETIVDSEISTAIDVIDSLYRLLMRMLLFLTGILMPLSLIARIATYEELDTSDVFGPSFTEIEEGLDNFYKLCLIMEQDFKNKTVEQLLQMNMIKKSNGQFELMNRILEKRIEICKKDNHLVARDIATNEIFHLDIDPKCIEKDKSYNLVIELDGMYLAKGEVVANNKVDDNYGDSFIESLSLEAFLDG